MVGSGLDSNIRELVKVQMKNNTASENNEEKFLIPNSTQIPNALLDRVMAVAPEPSWKCLMAVARQTYGWGKRWDHISISQLEKLTGLSNRCVIDHMQHLQNADLVKRRPGSIARYGMQYSINLSCDLDKAVNVLKLVEKKRKPREKHTGGCKKKVATSEPESPQPMNPVHTSEPGAGCMGFIATSEPESPQPMNPVHTQKPTIKTYYQNQGGKERPPSPSIVIAREKLAEHIRRNGPEKHDPEYDRKMFHCILAGRGGLSPTQVKEFLGEDAEWRKWPYWQHLDTQQEIEFPEPPKSSTADELDMTKFAKAEVKGPDGSYYSAWLAVSAELEKSLSRHTYETWLKPCKHLGARGKTLFVLRPDEEAFADIEDRFHDELEAARSKGAPGFHELRFITKAQAALPTNQLEVQLILRRWEKMAETKSKSA